MEGLFPRMNELYLYTSEMENLTRQLKSMLGLASTVSSTTLLVSLQAAIRQARGGAAGAGGGLGREESEDAQSLTGLDPSEDGTGIAGFVLPTAKPDTPAGAAWVVR